MAVICFSGPLWLVSTNEQLLEEKTTCEDQYLQNCVTANRQTVIDSTRQADECFLLGVINFVANLPSLGNNNYILQLKLSLKTTHN